MRPAFRLLADGADRTAEMSDRLLSIALSDAAGKESDTLDLVFDDRGPNGKGWAISPPRKGAVLAISIGWAGRALVPQGRFTVSGRARSGPDRTLTVKAKAADMRASLKAAKSRSWRGLTVGALVARIAGEHGLTPAVSREFASLPLAHHDQAGESDLHFLTRLGREMGAVAAPKDGRLVFAARGAGRSASGLVLPAFALTPDDVERWDWSDDDRADSGSTEARWRDVKGAETKTAKAGAGAGAGPKRRLRRTHRSEAEAKRAAGAAQADAKRAAAKFEATLLIARAELAAETPLLLAGFCPEADGRWPIARVDHNIDWSSGGFTTRLSAEPEVPS